MVDPRRALKSAHKTIVRHLGDALPALGALLQVFADHLGSIIVELAQAEQAQGLVRRMQLRRGFHGAVSGSQQGGLMKAA